MPCVCTFGSVTVNGEPFSEVAGGDLLEIGGENFVRGQTVGIVAHFNAALYQHGGSVSP